MIEVKDLYKSFGKLEVLKGITETIQDQEVVCVIGPSGSGKSTFLRCLNLLEQPTSGTIIVDGVEITDEKNDVNKIRENMGMVFQRFNLFPHMTIKENIMYGVSKLHTLYFLIEINTIHHLMSVLWFCFYIFFGFNI